MTGVLKPSQAAREFAWPYIPRNSITGQDREGFFAGRHDGVEAVQRAARFEQAIVERCAGTNAAILALEALIPHLWVPEGDHTFAAAVEQARSAIRAANLGGGHG